MRNAVAIAVAILSSAEDDELMDVLHQRTKEWASQCLDVDEVELGPGSLCQLSIVR